MARRARRPAGSAAGACCRQPRGSARRLQQLGAPARTRCCSCLPPARQAPALLPALYSACLHAGLAHLTAPPPLPSPATSPAPATRSAASPRTSPTPGCPERTECALMCGQRRMQAQQRGNGGGGGGGSLAAPRRVAPGRPHPNCVFRVAPVFFPLGAAPLRRGACARRPPRNSLQAHAGPCSPLRPPWPHAAQRAPPKHL